MVTMKIEVSIGEIVDKLSILQIKKLNITDEDKLINIKKEFDYLLEVVESELNFPTSSDLYLELFKINKKLWNIEDDIREKERNKSFDNEFIELARSVYFTNDERSKVKKRINLEYGSDFVEEKSYREY
jgi:hypothetical protein